MSPTGNPPLSLVAVAVGPPNTPEAKLIVVLRVLEQVGWEPGGGPTFRGPIRSLVPGCAHLLYDTDMEISVTRILEVPNINSAGAVMRFKAAGITLRQGIYIAQATIELGYEESLLPPFYRLTSAIVAGVSSNGQLRRKIGPGCNYPRFLRFNLWRASELAARQLRIPL